MFDRADVLKRERADGIVLRGDTVTKLRRDSEGR